MFALTIIAGSLAADPVLIEWPKSIGNFTCGDKLTGPQTLTVSVSFAEHCNATIVVDKLGYRNVKTMMRVKTRGAVHNGQRFERNGNILDLVNASVYRLKPEANNAFNQSASFPYYIQNGNLFFTKEDPNNPIECDNANEETVEQFMRMPLHASDDVTVPVCFYTYDADVSADKGETVLFNDKLFDARRTTRDYYDNTSLKETFSADMSMTPPQLCSSHDNMCLPGRCGMLDTNYLFRLSTLEDSAVHFYYDLSFPNGTHALLSNAVVNVLGRAQCDPMYGGGLVQDKDVTQIVTPPAGDFKSPLWNRFPDGFLSYTDDSLDDMFTNDGSILALPTYAYVKWSTVGVMNPNPMWMFKGQGDWEDGDPVGIRKIDSEALTKMPQCSDFGSWVQLSNDAFNRLEQAAGLGSYINASQNQYPAGYDPAYKAHWEVFPPTPSDPEGRVDITASTASFSPVFVLPTAHYQNISVSVENGEPLEEIHLNADGKVTGADVIIMPWAHLAAFKGESTAASNSCSEQSILFGNQCSTYDKFPFSTKTLPTGCGDKSINSFTLQSAPLAPQYSYPAENTTLFYMDRINHVHAPKTTFSCGSDFVAEVKTSTGESVSVAYGFPNRDAASNKFKITSPSDWNFAAYKDFTYTIVANEQTQSTLCFKSDLDDLTIAIKIVTVAPLKNTCPDGLDGPTAAGGGISSTSKVFEDINLPKGHGLCIPQPLIGKSEFGLWSEPRDDACDPTSYDYYGYYNTAKSPVRLVDPIKLQEWNPAKLKLDYENPNRPVLTLFNGFLDMNSFSQNGGHDINFWKEQDITNPLKFANITNITNWHTNWTYWRQNTTEKLSGNTLLNFYVDNMKPRVYPNAVLAPFLQDFPANATEIAKLVAMSNISNGDAGATAACKYLFGNDTTSDRFKACSMNGFFNQKLWYSSDFSGLKKYACPVYAGCILRPYGEMQASSDIPSAQFNTYPNNYSATNAWLYAHHTNLACMPMYTTLPTTSDRGNFIYAQDPGLPVLGAFFDSSSKDVRFANRYVLGGAAKRQEHTDTSAFSDAMTLNPHVIYPRTTTPKNYHPSFVQKVTTQQTQDAGDPKSTCLCGSSKAGISFFSTTAQFDPKSPNMTGIFQTAATKAIAQYRLNAVEANLGYRLTAYGWNELVNQNMPLVGLPIASQNSFVLVEQDLLRNPTLTDDERNQLFGQDAGQPGFNPSSPVSKYWFSNENQAKQLTDVKAYYATIDRTKAQNSSTELLPKKQNANEDYYFVTRNSNDEVCDLNEFTTPTGSEGNYATVIGTCYCSSNLCANITGCAKAEGALLDRFPDIKNTRNNVSYIYQLSPGTLIPDSIEVQCYRTWTHMYEFQGACLRYPYGMVQSWELPVAARNAFYPPPRDMISTSYNYCENLNTTVDSTPRFADCAGDHLTYSERVKFCDLTKNPLVDATLESVVIDRRPLDSVCSESLKACLIVPGTPAFGSLAALFNAEKRDLTGYTVLVAPFTQKLLVRLQMTPYKTQFEKAGADPPGTNLLTLDEQTRIYGFPASDAMFALLADLSSAPSVEYVIETVDKFVKGVSAVPPDVAACGADKYKIIAESGGKLAYSCADKDWWTYPYLNASDILINAANVTLRSAMIDPTLTFARNKDKCTVLQVGREGFQLPKAIFRNTVACAGSDCYCEMEPVIVFSGASAALSSVNAIVSDSNGGAPVHYLGYDGQFFGAHPFIDVSDAKLSVVAGTNSAYDFVAGFGRAVGTIRVDSTPPKECLVQAAHPKGPSSGKTLHVENAPVLNITDYIDVFGDAEERVLNPRPVDHSFFLTIVLAVLCFTLGVLVLSVIVCATCRFRIETFEMEAKLRSHINDFSNEVVNSTRNFQRQSEQPLTILHGFPPYDAVTTRFKTIHNELLIKTERDGAVKYYRAAELLTYCRQHQGVLRRVLSTTAFNDVKGFE